MFKDGTWHNDKLKLTVKIIDGVVYLRSLTDETIPLSIRTCDVLNNNNWKSIDK